MHLSSVGSLPLAKNALHSLTSSTDIGMSDHFLVWLELGRTAKNSRKQKRTIRRWRLDKFGDDVVREKYCEALQAEVEAFSEGISQMEEGGMRGNELVEGVLKEWENIVNRVARDRWRKGY